MLARIFIINAILLSLVACQTSPTNIERQPSEAKLSEEIEPQTSNVISYGRVISTRKMGEVTIYDDMWNIPMYVTPSPNLATLRYYGSKVKMGERQPSSYTVYPSGNIRQLKYNLNSSVYLKSEMQKSSILRYQFYNNGSIIYDEKSPDNRFGKLLKPRETYHSNSMGKSLVSYVVGHAICEGYIDGVDAKLDDWSLLKGTVYENQRLLDLLNMAARDSHVVDDTKGLLTTGRWYNTTPLASIAANELAGTAPKGAKSFHYNGLVTNVLLNYAIFKSGNEFNSLLNQIFRDKVKIADTVYFNKIRNSGSEAWYQFHATPEDYMRIAIAMMEDIQKETCVGRYLTELQESKIKKQMNKMADTSMHQSTNSYGGQFHLQYRGLARRAVLGLEGYGGQYILIDATTSRIVVVNTIHTDYDWNSLVLKAIKNGDIPN